MAIARPTERSPAQSRSGWGDPSQAPTLPEAVHALLRDGLGVRHPGRSPGSIDQLVLPEPSLPSSARDALARAVGDAYLRDDSQTRVRHLRGNSTPDLPQARGVELGGAPEAVLLPGDPDQVLELLRVCSEPHAAAVP